ncbi:MAG: PEP-CTERM sorting domain-containing protein [Deltaproteobacteria bacterium]|nr:PEP-CTERM sorting domain-containing protein [Deltaproteobacteria bacterium]
MKLSKIALLAILSGGLGLLLWPQVSHSTDSEVLSAVKAAAPSGGGEPVLNSTSASSERVYKAFEGQAQFHLEKAFDVTTSHGVVPIFRDNRGIYWHFQGGSRSGNDDDGRNRRSPGAPEPSTAVLFLASLLLSGVYLRRHKE